MGNISVTKEDRKVCKEDVQEEEKVYVQKEDYETTIRVMRQEDLHEGSETEHEPAEVLLEVRHSATQTLSKLFIRVQGDVVLYEVVYAASNSLQTDKEDFVSADHEN